MIPHVSPTTRHRLASISYCNGRRTRPTLDAELLTLVIEVHRHRFEADQELDALRQRYEAVAHGGRAFRLDPVRSPAGVCRPARRRPDRRLWSLSTGDLARQITPRPEVPQRRTGREMS